MGLATETSAAILTAFFWGGFTVARIFSIPLATRTQPKTLLLMSLAGGLLSITAIVLFPSSVLALWGGTLSLGMSIAAIFPSTISFAENIISLTGKLTRWFFVGAGLGAMGLPWLLGKFFENYGALAVVRALFVDTLLALIVFLCIVMMGRARQKN
jgi:FHS family Na+ dependent glucose MFS transporter 1